MPPLTPPHTARCQMLQNLHAALKRARGSPSTLTQTPQTDPPPAATPPQSSPDQSTHQQALPNQSQPCITLATLPQGSQQQPLPDSDLLSISPLSSQPWVYNEDPWTVGLAVFGDSADAFGAVLPQTHSGTGMQIPLQGVTAHSVPSHSTNVLESCMCSAVV